MIYFNSDYLEGAHPAIMTRLMETNMVQTVGYGEDEYCEAAREKIKSACQAPEADVHFLVGGTQTNTTVIAAILRPWQGRAVRRQRTYQLPRGRRYRIHRPQGHHPAHRQRQDHGPAGAGLRGVAQNDESTEHIVQPGMVYISFPHRKRGTLYSKAGSPPCMAPVSSTVCPCSSTAHGWATAWWPMERHHPAGTGPPVRCVLYRRHEVGALFGEAVVIMNETLKKRLPLHHEAARWPLGQGPPAGHPVRRSVHRRPVFTISRHAIDMAYQIREIFVSPPGIPLLFDSPHQPAVSHHAR